MTGFQIKPIESIQMRSLRTISKKLTAFAIGLVLLIYSAPSSYASFGVSEMKFSQQTFRAGDAFTMEFKVSRPVPADEKYSIRIGFDSTRDSFFGMAELKSGNYSEGIWQGQIRIASDLFSDFFTLRLSPVVGKEKPKLFLTQDQNYRIYVQGKPLPVAPLIEVSNITAEKSSYQAGETVVINFDTKILFGSPNEETYNPEVRLIDLRFGGWIRPNVKPYKPIAATGSYTTGKWQVKYPLSPALLSGQAQIVVHSPQGADKPALITNGNIFQIQGIVNEIKISDIVLDKDSYEIGSKAKVSFKTTSTNTTLNSDNKPIVYITDLEQSDEATDLPTNLISGSLDAGNWGSEFTIPSTLKPGDYILAFYNKSGTIREVGPGIKVRTSSQLKLEFSITTPQKLGSSPISFSSTSASNLPIKTSSMDETICSISGSTILLKRAGKCIISSEVAGDSTWAAAKVEKSLDIYEQKLISITCTKGKTIKKVTALKPKCPSGYKVKR